MTKIPTKKTHRINVTYDAKSYEQIKLAAAKENKSMSEWVMQPSLEKLNGQVNRDNVDFLSVIFREQIKNILEPYFERLISLSAKTCVQSSTAAYLTAETIAKLVPEEYQEDVVDVYTAARKKGMIYTRQKLDKTELEEND